MFGDRKFERLAQIASHWYNPRKLFNFLRSHEFHSDQAAPKTGTTFASRLSKKKAPPQESGTSPADTGPCSASLRACASPQVNTFFRRDYYDLRETRSHCRSHAQLRSDRHLTRNRPALSPKEHQPILAA